MLLKALHGSIERGAHCGRDVGLLIGLRNNGKLLRHVSALDVFLPAARAEARITRIAGWRVRSSRARSRPFVPPGMGPAMSPLTRRHYPAASSVATISIKKYLDNVTLMYHFCSSIVLMKETSSCPVPSKPLRAPLSIDARRVCGEPSGQTGPSTFRTLALLSPASRRGARRLSGVAGKWRRKGLKRLNQRREMALASEPRTHKIWYGSGWPCAAAREWRKGQRDSFWFFWFFWRPKPLKCPERGQFCAGAAAEA